MEISKKAAILDFIRYLKEAKVHGVRRGLTVLPQRGRAIVIIGPRRAGKTWLLLYHAKKSGGAYLDLEDLAFRGLKVGEIYGVIEGIYKAELGSFSSVFLDEVQVLRQWEVLVRTLLNRSYVVWLTGSSSKLLSKEIATQLRGRSLTYLLLPFSFQEYLRVRNIKQDFSTIGIEKLKSNLLEYLRFGGFPEVVLSKDEWVKYQLLKEYIDMIFLKDVIERHNVKNIPVARALVNTLLPSFSSRITLRRVEQKLRSGGFRFGHELIYEYFSYFQDSFLFFFTGSYSSKPHLRESWPKKLYLVDLGLIPHLADVGRRMENVVFLELLRRKNFVPSQEIYYFSTSNYEVDFVVKHGPKVEELIQVTYASEKDEIPRRELKALLKAADLLKSKHLTVITWDYAEEEKIDGKMIRYVPLWKWLLD